MHSIIYQNLCKVQYIILKRIIEYKYILIALYKTQYKCSNIVLHFNIVHNI
jgi:hypothetical protein